MQEREKTPPHSMDAEQSVLGALLIDPDAINRVAKFLRPEDFYLESHRSIYEAILEMDEAGQPVDLVTVADYLRRRDLLDKVGGPSYLASLAAMVPTTVNVEYYGRIVEEKALLRNLIGIAGRIAGLGYEGEEAEKLLVEAEQMLLELGMRRASSSFHSIRDILLETFKYIEHLYHHKGEVTGVPTGFIDLDRLCSGMQPGDLIIAAGRPSMGKTSFGLCIASHVAVRLGKPVAIFSLEMSKEQLVQRILCAEAMVDQHRLRTGMLSEEDWARLTMKARELSRAPLFIDDSAVLNVRQLRARAKRLQAERGLDLILVDYLQLMQGSRRAENRQQEIAEISRSLKGLAKELNVPVLALAQLSRSVEQRQDKRPIMSDLRESGSLEQDADLVMFIYRDEYYRPDTEKKGIAELIVAKQRNGPVGTIELAYLKEYTRFMNLSRRSVPEE